MTKLNLDWARYLTRRPGTMDEFIVKEIERSYGHLKFKNRSVLDVGACFGAFSAFADYHEARRITACEPDPSNYLALIRNADSFILYSKHVEQWVCENVAVVKTTDPPMLDLWLSENAVNLGTHSLVIKKNRTRVPVMTRSLKSLLEASHANLVKIDCEGYEHDLLSEIVDGVYPWPSAVTQVVVEFNLNRKAWRYASTPRIMNAETGAFKKKDGWKLVRQFGFTASGWNGVASWER